MAYKAAGAPEHGVSRTPVAYIVAVGDLLHRRSQPQQELYTVVPLLRSRTLRCRRGTEQQNTGKCKSVTRLEEYINNKPRYGSGPWQRLASSRWEDEVHHLSGAYNWNHPGRLQSTATTQLAENFQWHLSIQLSQQFS